MGSVVNKWNMHISTPHSSPVSIWYVYMVTYLCFFSFHLFNQHGMDVWCCPLLVFVCWFHCYFIYILVSTLRRTIWLCMSLLCGFMFSLHWSLNLCKFVFGLVLLSTSIGASMFHLVSVSLLCLWSNIVNELGHWGPTLLNNVYYVPHYTFK